MIFRRIASKTRKTDKGENTEIFISLPSEQAQVIRHRVLESLANESDRLVRNKVGDAVADIARQYSENGQSTLLSLSLGPLYSALCPSQSSRHV